MGLSLCSLDEATMVVLRETQGSKGLLGAGNISTRGTAFLAILWTKQPTEKPSKGCRERDGLVGQEWNREG